MFFSISSACVPESQWVDTPVYTTAVAAAIGGRYGQAWRGGVANLHQRIPRTPGPLSPVRHRARLGALRSYDALVEAFVKREIDLAWDAPLAYVRIKRRLQNPCQVVAMRDVDVNFTTHFITHAGSGISTVQDLKGKRLAFGSRGSVQARLLPYYFLQQLGLNPAHDLAVCSFCEEREASAD